MNQKVEHIYHLYPLGTASHQGFRSLISWTEHLKSLGITSILLGPIWESEDHGYETIDYRMPDRRLGTWEELVQTIGEFKSHGFKLYLDGVFNHCSRRLSQWVDVETYGRESPYWHWFKRNSEGQVQGWNGHSHLPEFDLNHRDVIEFHLSNLQFWIEHLDIDGVRFDAADVMPKTFLREMMEGAQGLKPDFSSVAEVIHGDYHSWHEQGGVSSVTQYELYKSIWSSCNDKNMFELAWSLERAYGSGGLSRNYLPYLFLDNHDVTRLSSKLEEPKHFFAALCLMYLIPGHKTMYYGSEVGIPGKKRDTDDWNLRPNLNPKSLEERGTIDGRQEIRRLWSLVQSESGLQGLDIQVVANDHDTIQFTRGRGDEQLYIAISLATESDHRSVGEGLASWAGACGLVDLLNDPETILPRPNNALYYPSWARVFKRRSS